MNIQTLNIMMVKKVYKIIINCLEIITTENIL